MLLIVLAGVVSAIAPAVARAEAEVVVDSTTPTATAEPDGSRKAELKFTNASSRPVTLTSTVVGEECDVTPAKAILPPEKIEPVTLRIPQDCGSTTGVKIEMTPDPATGEVKPFVIEPTTAAHTETEWKNLWAIVIAFVGALVLLGAELIYLGESGIDGLSTMAFATLKQPMTNLPSTWKFDDNWVTNVTAIGALFTAIFTTATGKAFLGQESEASFALATVGALVAGTLAAAAPVVLAATNSSREGVGAERKLRKESCFTVGGVMLAAALVLASAYGQLWIVMKTAESLELGGLAHNLPIPFSVAGLVLLFYSWRAFREIIERGLQPAHGKSRSQRTSAELPKRPFVEAEGNADPGDGVTSGEVELVEHWPAPSALL